MRFVVATIAALAASAFAAPSYGPVKPPPYGGGGGPPHGSGGSPPYGSGGAPYVPCSGIQGSAQCCATDVLGLAALNCGNIPTTPASASDFKTICAKKGQQAKCCAIPILGQALICSNPTGV